MKVSDLNKVDKEFTEAKNHWELEKLYIDLGSAKGKSLTPVEKNSCEVCFAGLVLQKSPIQFIRIVVAVLLGFIFPMDCINI